MAMAFTMTSACQNTVSGVKGGRGFHTLSQIHKLPKTLSFHVLNSLSPPLSYPTRYARQVLRNSRVACTAASVGGGSSASGDENPYKVLGVSPLEKFEKIKASYTRKYKDAERRGDDAAMAQLERAYDKIMMAQLSNRKQGLTFGSVKVAHPQSVVHTISTSEHTDACASGPERIHIGCAPAGCESCNSACYKALFCLIHSHNGKFSSDANEALMEATFGYEELIIHCHRCFATSHATADCSTLTTVLVLGHSSPPLNCGGFFEGNSVMILQRSQKASLVIEGKPSSSIASVVEPAN